MSLNPHRRLVAVLSSAVLGAVVVSTLGGAVPAAAASPPTNGTKSAVPLDDTYTTAEARKRTVGSSTKLVASTTPSMHKTAYLKFVIPNLPEGAELVRARIELSSNRNQPAKVRLHTVPDSRWREESLSHARAPQPGKILATATSGARTKTLTFDVTKAVKPGHTYSFAITTPKGTSAVHSKEATKDGPRLVVSWKRPPPAPAYSTLFGTNVKRYGDDTYAEALSRQNSYYGNLEVVRSYYTGLPQAWPNKMGNDGGAVVISFKALPQDVNAGKHDAFFAKWFADAPRNIDLYWSYWHEPEDDVEEGRFTAAQWREAFKRLDRLADHAHNPRMKTTPILMCYTLKPGSDRDFYDYYPGRDVVDVQGWDCYNRGSDSGQYYTPDFVLRALVAKSAEIGKPWGMGEYGSKLAVGDDGTGRAQWLKASATYARNNGALFVTYFDSRAGNVADPEYRLLDEPSRQAWRWAVSES